MKPWMQFQCSASYCLWLYLHPPSNEWNCNFPLQLNVKMHMFGSGRGPLHTHTTCWTIISLACLVWWSRHLFAAQQQKSILLRRHAPSIFRSQTACMLWAWYSILDEILVCVEFQSKPNDNCCCGTKRLLKRCELFSRVYCHTPAPLAQSNDGSFKDFVHASCNKI